MTDPIDEKVIAQALQTQVMELGKQIQEFTLSADKYFGIATSLIVAALTLALTRDYSDALIALPFALGGILLYAMQLFTERAARAGMRRALEQKLRSEYMYFFAAVEDCLDGSVNQRRASVVASTFLYGVAMLGAIVAAIVLAVRRGETVGVWLPWLVTVASVLIIAGMLLAYRELSSAQERAYQYALNLEQNSQGGGRE